LIPSILWYPISFIYYFISSIENLIYFIAIYVCFFFYKILVFILPYFFYIFILIIESFFDILIILILIWFFILLCLKFIFLLIIDFFSLNIYIFFIIFLYYNIIDIYFMYDISFNLHNFFIEFLELILSFKNFNYNNSSLIFYYFLHVAYFKIISYMYIFFFYNFSFFIFIFKILILPFIEFSLYLKLWFYMFAQQSMKTLFYFVLYNAIDFFCYFFSKVKILLICIIMLFVPILIIKFFIFILLKGYFLVITLLWIILNIFKYILICFFQFLKKTEMMDDILPDLELDEELASDPNTVDDVDLAGNEFFGNRDNVYEQKKFFKTRRVFYFSSFHFLKRSKQKKNQYYSPKERPYISLNKFLWTKSIIFNRPLIFVSFLHKKYKNKYSLLKNSMYYKDFFNFVYKTQKYPVNFFSGNYFYFSGLQRCKMILKTYWKGKLLSAYVPRRKLMKRLLKKKKKKNFDFNAWNTKLRKRRDIFFQHIEKSSNTSFIKKLFLIKERRRFVERKKRLHLFFKYRNRLGSKNKYGLEVRRRLTHFFRMKRKYFAKFFFLRKSFIIPKLKKKSKINKEQIKYKEQTKQKGFFRFFKGKFFKKSLYYFFSIKIGILKILTKVTSFLKKFLLALSDLNRIDIYFYMYSTLLSFLTSIFLNYNLNIVLYFFICGGILSVFIMYEEAIEVRLQLQDHYDLTTFFSNLFIRDSIMKKLYPQTFKNIYHYFLLQFYKLISFLKKNKRIIIFFCVFYLIFFF
jgi:hypothetical protein